jgi:hypothetical protein
VSKTQWNERIARSIEEQIGVTLGRGLMVRALGAYLFAFLRTHDTPAVFWLGQEGRPLSLPSSRTVESAVIRLVSTLTFTLAGMPPATAAVGRALGTVRHGTGSRGECGH